MASSFLVLSFVPFLLLLLYVVGIYEKTLLETNLTPFDLYKRRYDIQKSTINSTFFRLIPGTAPLWTPQWKKMFPIYINATLNAVIASGVTFSPEDDAAFRKYAEVVEVYYEDTYNVQNVTRIMHTFGYYQTGTYILENVYNELKWKNVTTWGPVESVLTIQTPVWNELIWNIIKTKTNLGYCQAFYYLGLVCSNNGQDLVKNATFYSKYDPVLCSVTKQTMAKWYAFLQDVQTLFKRNVFANRGIDQEALTANKFMRYAKLYRPSVYDAYFESTTNYPLVQAMKNTKNLPIFTTQEKAYITQVAVNFQTEFPNLATIQARQDFMSKKFSEIIDQKPSNFETFSKIPLNNNEGQFYDLIIWTCQKVELEAQYQKALAS